MDERSSNTGKEKEEINQQDIIPTRIDISVGKTETSKSPDQAKETRDETRITHDYPLCTGKKSGLNEANESSSTQCQNEHFDGDVKESDHLKKIPISGYIHDTSPVKPSRSNYMYFNFK